MHINGRGGSQTTKFSLRAKIDSRENIMTRHRNRRTGHLTRMTDVRLTHQNPLLRTRIWQETTQSPTSSTQGSDQNHHTKDSNRSGELEDGNCR